MHYFPGAIFNKTTIEKHVCHINQRINMHIIYLIGDNFMLRSKRPRLCNEFLFFGLPIVASTIGSVAVVGVSTDTLISGVTWPTSELAVSKSCFIVAVNSKDVFTCVVGRCVDAASGRLSLVNAIISTVVKELLFKFPPVSFSSFHTFADWVVISKNGDESFIMCVVGLFRTDVDE